jgi:hypothetical protein
MPQRDARYANEARKQSRGHTGPQPAAPAALRPYGNYRPEDIGNLAIQLLLRRASRPPRAVLRVQLGRKRRRSFDLVGGKLVE